LDIDALEIHNMDTVIYKKVMGRWRADAIKALNSKFFWVQLILATRLCFIERFVSEKF